ncbi:MAG: hypothetical protein IKL27_04415 [Oscillospiraceae bacterium]|nr:hypothetical protein [Oscillospiraceae bacterium]
MDDLQSKISAIFSSPESMEQIRNLAQSLAGGGEDMQSPVSTPPQSTEPSLQMDPRIMQVMTRAMSEFSKPSEASALLGALRPYLSQDRISKVDRAMNIARLAKIARTIIPEFGGDKRV